MNLFKSEFFGIVKTPSSYSSLSASKPFNFQNTHCAFLQLITPIVGMSTRAPKMYTLGTYYNIIDTHIKLQ